MTNEVKWVEPYFEEQDEPMAAGQELISECMYSMLLYYLHTVSADEEALKAGSDLEEQQQFAVYDDAPSNTRLRA